MVSGYGRGWSRSIPGVGDCRVRFRRTDRFSPENPQGKDVVNRRIANGIIKEPIVRAEDAVEQRDELVAMRRCVIEAHNVADFMIKSETVKVPAGRFEETCDYQYIGKDENVDRVLELKDDRMVLPLRIGVLKHLGFADCVQEILLRAEDSGSPNFNRQDREMVGWMSMPDALNIEDLANYNLTGRSRIRVASELLVSAFLHRYPITGLFLTANHFYYDPEKSPTYLAPLRARVIDETVIEDRSKILFESKRGKGRWAFVYRSLSAKGNPKVQRWATDARFRMNCNVLYEVYEA